MMVWLILVAGVVALYGVADAASPVVSNVVANQRAGTMGANAIRSYAVGARLVRQVP